MIPEIKFRYSTPYDEGYRKNKTIQKKLEEKGEKYPSKEKVKDYSDKIKPVWEKESKKILQEISDLTGLSWKEKEITCYVIGYGRCMSDPLTIRIFKNKESFIDILTHELIHQIQIQNSKIMEKWWNYVSGEWKDELIITKNHILLHAIHHKLLESMFGKERLKKNINDTISEPYRRAWEIVKDIGSDNIIKKFQEII